MKDTNFKQTLAKTREYLDYLEEHYDNVQKAWKEIQVKCDRKGFDFIYDDYKFHTLDAMIKEHDISKLSLSEFCQYRKKFFPNELESKQKEVPEFKEAWEHHYNNNPHHWENWANKKYYNPSESTFHCVHMVVDWVAMGYKFKDNAREYYKRNKKTIILPEWAEGFINEIFDCLYGKEGAENEKTI